MLSLCLALAAMAATTGPTIEFEGNVVLSDDVYLTVLQLSQVTASATVAVQTSTLTATSTQTQSNQVITPQLSVAQAVHQGHPESAELLQYSLLKFLRDSGYAIAKVNVTSKPHGFVIKIDEGRLDKILFLREGTLANIQLRFAIVLPGDVFNKPLLERQLAQLVRETSVLRADYEIVAVADVEHRGVQMVEPTIIRGLRLLDEAEDHELHIRLKRSKKKAGWGLKLGYSGADGLFGGFSYKVGEALFDNDRIETESTAGIYIGNTIDSPKNPFGISRLKGRLRWLAPPMFANVVRAFIEGKFELTGRRRADLQLENYFYAPVAGTVNFEVTLGRGAHMTIGGGVEHRKLFGLDEGEEEVPILRSTPGDDTRFLLALQGELQFNPNELRLDRAHKLVFTGAYRGRLDSTSGSPITRTSLAYDKVWPNGWDELRLNLFGEHVWGDVPFYDEMSIGDGFIRGGFHQQVFVQRASALSLEYRMSLSRDMLKVSVFNDFAVYGKRNELREKEGVRIADTFGGGVHVLLLDAFQVNAYLGVAVDQDLGLGIGFKAQLARAF